MNDDPILDKLVAQITATNLIALDKVLDCATGVSFIGGRLERICFIRDRIIRSSNDIRRCLYV